MKAKTIARTPQRYPTQLETKFRVFESDAPWRPGKVVNLSETGLCLEADHDLGAGDLLELVIQSTDRKGQLRKRLMCAKIVWLREGRAGLQFVKKRRQV